MLGTILLSSLIGITLNLYILSKPGLAVIYVNPLLSISQVSALIGTVLLSYNYFLSSRLPILEKIHGGLDRVYRLHQAVGIFAFILLLQHPLLLAVNVLPDRVRALTFIYPYQNLINMYGFVAIFSLAVLIVMTLYTRLPYHVWKSTHEYMGIPILAGFAHILFIPSDISGYLPLRTWMFSLVILGILFFIYKRFLYRILARKYAYTVKEVNLNGDVMEVFLTPLADHLRFRSGQFVYIRFIGIGDDQSHPFSISSAPTDDYLRISIKILGDHTLALKHIEAGQAAVVWGPFGTFSEKFFTSQPAILVAGGIGVTPFLSMIKSASETVVNRSICLYYCTSAGDEAIYDREINELCASYPDLLYHLRLSRQHGRLTATQILQDNQNIRKANIFLCGPPPMMMALRIGLLNNRIRPNRIFIEDFSMK